MLDVVSLVNFDNPSRARYLERSFGSFYKYGYPVRHWVLDSSRELAAQQPYYERFGVKVMHRPGLPFGERLREATRLVENDYFLFLPDDFAWIFDFPMARAIEQCRAHGVAELKLTARGQRWYAQPGADPVAWFEGARVQSGEVLRPEGDLFVSRRLWFRDFHEQFSLACNLLQTEFARWVFERVSPEVKSPGQAEKQAYVRLLLRRYATAYYKMWIPAFHFIDLNVEGANLKNREKAETMLIEENFAVYNRRFNV